MEEPVITSPFTTTGGDVMEYAPGSKGAIRRPAFRSTIPLRPNPAQDRPSRASSANSCDCAVATNMRRRQTAPAGADSSSHVDTPRLAKSPYDTSRLIFGSNTQRSRPVVGSSAITRPSGVRSEEHTSELQSPYDLVCRLLLEKKKKHRQNRIC